MIDADKRCRFCQSISLNHGVSQPPPELFCVFVKRGPAADESQEFPSELSANAAEDPPAPQKVFLLCIDKTPAEKLLPASIVQIALYFLFQRLEHSRHTHQH